MSSKASATATAATTAPAAAPTPAERLEALEADVDQLRGRCLALEGQLADIHGALARSGHPVGGPDDDDDEEE